MAGEPLTAVSQLENLRNRTRVQPQQVAGDVVPIPTEKNLNSLQWQFIKSQIPFLGRGMDPNQIRQQIMDVNSQLRPKQVSENITEDWLLKHKNRLLEEVFNAREGSPYMQNLDTRLKNNDRWYNETYKRNREDFQ